MANVAAPTAAATGTAPAAHGHPVSAPYLRSRGPCIAGYDCSGNWSGYVESGGAFSSVTATWQVPSVQGSAAPSDTSTWVGVGGDASGPLIQDGTSESVTTAGQARYEAWWEVVPGRSNNLPATQVSVRAVHPGDTVTATVQANGGGSWTFTMSDPAWPSVVTKTVSVADSSSVSTAEWIQEDPTDAATDTLFPLADFGSVGFQDMGATTTAPSDPAPLLLRDRSDDVLAYPGQLSGDAFTDTYGALPPGPAPTPTPVGPGPGPSPTPPPDSVPAGYWQLGGDGGVFAFGDAAFYGSTGALALQRPVVAMAPTSDFGGYNLVASDGGVFAFGDAGYFGSIPALGLAPAGTPGAARALSAPIVGMVPSPGGGGYTLLGADGGVFAFGDATFEGSCPSIGGCVGTAVAVMPDATGDGYWLVTSLGLVYAFGDAPYFGGPGPLTVGGVGVPVTAAVAAPDGSGYWILFADGTVAAFGSAANLGSPGAAQGVTAADPARAIVATADGGGYWVMSADGAVYAYGDATYQGGMNGMPLNAGIVAAAGW